MIPRSHKFPLRTEFLSFRAKSKKFLSPLVTCYVLRVAHSSRLAVVVPKKLSKLATTRNWLKRLTYDTLWPLIKNRQLDCVVVYKPLPLRKSTATQQLIISELQTLFPPNTQYLIHYTNTHASIS